MKRRSTVLSGLSLVLAAVGLVSMATTANAQDPLFAPPVNYGVGQYPISVFSADLDGDGDNDLAVGYLFGGILSENVSILLNNGDGTFAAAVNYETGIGSGSIFSVDLDGDNDNDLSVTNRESNNISILLNNGDGTFQVAVNYGAGDDPSSVFAADLDGDNDNDLAISNCASDNVSILLNNGDGTFAAAVNYGAGDCPGSVFSVDLDGDNDNDLAVVNWYSDNVSILLNNGDGTFASPVNYGAGNSPSSVFSADLDGDGDYDLAVANDWSNNVSILLNNGNGTFAPAVNYGAGDGPESVYAADLDGDSDFDLAVTNGRSDNVSILLNNGDGTFATAENYGAGGGPVSVFSADLDGDGDNDLAVANAGSDNVSILINLSNVGPQYLAEKQAIIDYFNSEPFYPNAEQDAQTFIDVIQTHIDDGTVTAKELEAVLRLLLVEEATKAAYKSSDEIGAVPIANLTARCMHKAATALFMKMLFSALEKAIKPLKDVPGLGWFYDKVHDATSWFDKTLHSFNQSVVQEIFDPLIPMIVAQQGLSQPEARELAMKFGLDFLKAWEQKLAGIPLEELNESLIESKLTELNLWLYESGILIYDPTDPGLDPLYIGGTEPILQSAVDAAASQEFEEGGTQEIVNSIRNERIPEIVADNTGCVGFINGTITVGEWAEVTQLIILAVLLIVLIVGLIAAIIGCGPSGGIGCVLAAIAGLGIWGTLLQIQGLLTWAKIAVFTLGAGTGAFQLHANLPSQLWDAKHIAFDQALKVLLVGGSIADMPHYNIPSEWSDSLAAASDSVASRLAIIRSQIVAGDWVGVQGELDGLDSALDRLSSTSLIASALLGYSYMCNNSDTLEGVDSILHFTMAHGSANDMSLGMAQVALGFASVAEPDGADRDTLVMIVDDCIGKLQAIGPAYESAFGDFDSLGFTVPPVVVIIDYQVTEDDSGKVFESSVKNVSDVPVHQVLARLTCSDSSMAPITPESDTLIDVLGPNEDSLFRWRIETGETDTLFQLELIIEPDSLPGDFIGDNRIITLYYPTAEYQYVCGDVDGTGAVNVGDLTYLVDYLFFEGPAPPVMVAANVDGEGGVNVVDLIYMVDYLFFEGPEPVCGPIE